MSLDEDYAPWPNADEAGHFDAAVRGRGLAHPPYVATVDGGQRPQLTRGEIESVVAHRVRCDDEGAELFALLKLTGRRWASVVAECDRTGWDCAAWSDIRIAKTKREAVGALRTSGRYALGFAKEDNSDVDH